MLTVALGCGFWGTGLEQLAGTGDTGFAFDGHT
jgi:hypothetical protein